MSVLSQEQREAHLETSRELFARMQGVEEVTDGYRFSLASEPDVIVKAAEFITLEKLCCPFLNFALEVDAGGPVWLRLTGRAGVKDFIREEISGILGTPIFPWARPLTALLSTPRQET